MFKSLWFCYTCRNERCCFVDSVLWRSRWRCSFSLGSRVFFWMLSGLVCYGVVGDVPLYRWRRSSFSSWSSFSCRVLRSCFDRVLGLHVTHLSRLFEPLLNISLVGVIRGEHLLSKRFIKVLLYCKHSEILYPRFPIASAWLIVPSKRCVVLTLYCILAGDYLFTQEINYYPSSQGFTQGRVAQPGLIITTLQAGTFASVVMAEALRKGQQYSSAWM